MHRCAIVGAKSECYVHQRHKRASVVVGAEQCQFDVCRPRLHVSRRLCSLFVDGDVQTRTTTTQLNRVSCSSSFFAVSNYNKPTLTSVPKPTPWPRSRPLTFWPQNEWVSRTHVGTLCVSFGDPSCIGFWDVVRKTDRQTNASENLTPRLPSRAWHRFYIVPVGVAAGRELSSYSTPLGWDGSHPKRRQLSPSKRYSRSRNSQRRGNGNKRTTGKSSGQHGPSTRVTTGLMKTSFGPRGTTAHATRNKKFS